MQGSKLTKLISFGFSISKNLKEQSGHIIDGKQFLDKSFMSRILHKFKNNSCLAQMEKTLKDFDRKKSISSLLQINNNLIDIIKNYKYRQIQQYAHNTLSVIIKPALKKKQSLQEFLSLNPAVSMQIIQARSYPQSQLMLKSTDTWFQLICQFTDIQNKTCHRVLQRHKAASNWKFIKLSI